MFGDSNMPLVSVNEGELMISMLGNVTLNQNALQVSAQFIKVNHFLMLLRPCLLPTVTFGVSGWLVSTPQSLCLWSTLTFGMPRQRKMN